ncbi:hypothetical protein FOZ61_009727 [Perkinsus olseni]|uniref:Uncharacterized protein n=1 Tax=Perkinsus olseni TaxID=32597 RepID=A0A7J6L0M7_PEROL|nr:hypothetical protein FOZ61_009727 [Perkinsus olseni]
MGVTFSRLGLLLLPAVAIQSHVKEKKVNKNWVEPEVGHYESHSPTGVGSLPSLKLDIWREDTGPRGLKFECNLGGFINRGYLDAIPSSRTVALGKVDGSVDPYYQSGKCSRLKYEGGSTAINLAYSLYEISVNNRGSPKRLMFLCPVDNQGWTVYLRLERKKSGTIQRLFSPVQLVKSASSEAISSPPTIEEVTIPPSGGELVVAVSHRVNRKALASPRVGYFTGKGDTVGVDLDITPSGGQLTLRPHSRGVRVELDRVPLVAAPWGCWRFDMHKSLHKNVDTLKAVEDLVGITSNNMDDFHLCYSDGRWQLQLGSPSPLVVPLDRQAMKRHASLWLEWY